jgi:hypothetical protein
LILRRRTKILIGSVLGIAVAVIIAITAISRPADEVEEGCFLPCTLQQLIIDLIPLLILIGDGSEPITPEGTTSEDAVTPRVFD